MSDDPIADMPVITVAEIEAMGDDAWENVLDRIEREHRPFLLKDEEHCREAVILPYSLWCELKAAAGEPVEDATDDFGAKLLARKGSAPALDPVRTPEDDRFAETFEAARGKLGPDHDLDV